MASQAFNRDIMQWENFPNYDLLYTDPPWGNRMVKWFETLEAKDTGVKHENSLERILNHLGSLADKNKPMIVEYAVKDWQFVVEVLEKQGHKLYKKVDGIQSMGRPFVLLVFNVKYDFKDGLKGAEYPHEAVKDLKPRVVFDPFAGIGFTAKAVQSAGADYIGSEINGKRFKQLQAVVATRASV